MSWRWSVGAREVRIQGREIGDRHDPLPETVGSGYDSHWDSGPGGFRSREDRPTGGLMGSRVVLAMSGGVDSSVAAHLLLEQGHEVIGLFMRTGATVHDDRRTRTCCSASDAIDAQSVADRL